MKKLVALLLSVMMCFACVSALADTYVSWYTYGDVYLSSVRSEMEADFAKLNLTINGSDANGNQQVQSDFISTALMNNDCEAIVVNLVESGAISTAQTIMNQIQAAGIPTVWFNRPVSTSNEEAANLFLNNPASAFVGTNFEDAGVMQGGKRRKVRAAQSNRTCEILDSFQSGTCVLRDKENLSFLQDTIPRTGKTASALLHTVCTCEFIHCSQSNEGCVTRLISRANSALELRSFSKFWSTGMTWMVWAQL